MSEGLEAEKYECRNELWQEVRKLTVVNERAWKVRWYTRNKGESTSVCLIRQLEGCTNLVFAAVRCKKDWSVRELALCGARMLAESAKDI